MPAALEVRVEAPAALEDELLGELWALGCDGSWSEPGGEAERVVLHGFFAAGELVRVRQLAARFAGRSGVVVGSPIPIADTDWLAEYRRNAVPIDVGRRFRVDPREPESGPAVESGEGRRLLRLPARTAFGIGSHESTRLMIELLEEAPPVGLRVLDVGTGSGILAFAALELGAREVVACDLDPAAALLLPEFQRLNARSFAAWVGSLDALAPAARGRFDLALVNVVPSEIAADLPALAALLAPRGRALFSGLLLSEAGRAEAAVAAVGLAAICWRESGEWTAFVAERRP